MRRELLLGPLALAVAVSISLPFAAAAQQPAPRQVAGIAYPAQVSVGGRALQLNGAGIRHKFIIKVYTAGLYLAGRAATPDEVLAAPGPKRLHVVMLREIDSKELGKLFVRGMEDNAPRDEFAKSIPGTVRMGEIFSMRKKLTAGENFSVDWVPGAGTVILVNGEPQGDPIREPEFYRSLLRIWLGPNPADALLKDQLLGKEAGGTGN